MPLPLIVARTILLAAAALSSTQGPPAAPADCHEWHECRQMALQAYDRADYERFHDLAWRAIQTGSAHNTDLMYLLARAQSLSGRPHDALVMLGRLLDQGIVPDVSGDDFRAVRELHQWPDLEQRLAGAGTPPAARPEDAPPASPQPVASAIPSPPATTPPGPTPPVPAPPTPAPPAPRPPATPAPPPAPPAAATAKAPPAASSVRVPSAGRSLKSEDALQVPAAIATSAGLAYDRVSSRFVVADARQRKLQIIDERSHRVMDLVTSASAGFFGITGFEIDDARGDLWVVSAESAGAHDGRPQSALHKIQLVSGRPIERVPVPEDDGPCRLVDVAVTPSGTVFVLDAAGRRLLRFQPATRSFATVAALNAAGVTSLAAPGEHLVYVAGTEGIIAVDTATGVATPVPAARGVRLATIERLRWAHDSLLAIQRLDDGTRRSVRFRLARGRAVSADVIDTGLPMDGGAAATLSGDDVYVAVRQAGSDGDEIVIRRSRVR